MKIGEKLRDTRLAKGLSLQDVANATGLTASFLSLLERDLSNPSLASLRDVCKVLDIPMFNLFVDDEPSSAVVQREQRRMLTFSDNPGLQIYRLSPVDHQAKLELLLLRFEPGISNHPEKRSHRGAEVTLCVRGEVQVFVGEEEYRLREGDCIYLDSTVPHRYMNVSMEPAELLMTVSPPSN